jgi:biotin transporter BioY
MPDAESAGFLPGFCLVALSTGWERNLAVNSMRRLTHALTAATVLAAVCGSTTLEQV